MSECIWCGDASGELCPCYEQAEEYGISMEWL